MKNLSFFGLAIVGLAACTPKTDDTPQPYDSGVLVVNAGNFNDNNGTLSFLNRSNKTITFDTFNKENSRGLTGGLRDYAEIGGKGILLVDNSTGQDKIEIVNARTMKALGTVQADVVNPRYVLGIADGKAYVTCWDNLNADYSFKQGYVAVIDLNTFTVKKKIPVGRGPEQMVVVGNEVFVANQGGDTVLSVINTTTDEVSQSVPVTGSSPTELEIDANGKLWITADSQLVRMNPSSKAVEVRVYTGSRTASGISMSKDKQTIYLLYNFYDAADGYKFKGSVLSMGINDTQLQTAKPLINRAFTGLGLDPTEGILYAGLTPSYKQAGYVFRYQTTGTLIDSVKAEIAPSGFYFK